LDPWVNITITVWSVVAIPRVWGCISIVIVARPVVVAVSVIGAIISTASIAVVSWIPAISASPSSSIITITPVGYLLNQSLLVRFCGRKDGGSDNKRLRGVKSRSSG